MIAYRKLFVILFLLFFLTSGFHSCDPKTEKITSQSEKHTQNAPTQDNIIQDYAEGKASDIKKKLHQRPSSSKINNSDFSKGNLFGYWAKTKASHAEFKLDEKSFYVLGHEGKEDSFMPYNINENKIMIYFPDKISTGLIKKAQNDSLVIYWASGEYNIYVRSGN